MSVSEKLAIVEENVPKVYQAGYTKGVTDGTSISVIYPKDVNFYDYDGTLLHSFTASEAQKLAELPELPEREGLICQGWNYDLETIKSYNRAVDVGAMYITDDGRTRFYIEIVHQMGAELYFKQSVSDGVVIDWGDGSATETLSGTGNVKATHTYQSSGDYVISLDVAAGCDLVIGQGEWYSGVMGASSFANNGTTPYPMLLRKVEIGSRVSQIAGGAFGNHHSLSSVTIPVGVTSIGKSTFQGCSRLTFLVLPKGLTTISTNADMGTFRACYCLKTISIPHSVTSTYIGAFYDCHSLASINIPEGASEIGKSCFYQCHSLSSVTIPNGVQSIGESSFYRCAPISRIVIPKSVVTIANGAFGSCYGIQFYDFTAHTSVPTLSNTLYTQPYCQIKVPASLYDEWIAATNWSNYADYIVAV